MLFKLNYSTEKKKNIQHILSSLSIPELITHYSLIRNLTENIKKLSNIRETTSRLTMVTFKKKITCYTPSHYFRNLENDSSYR